MSFLKMLQGTIPTVTILFTRSIFGSLASSMMVASAGREILRTQRFPLHLFRISLGLVGIICTYYAYSNLPLAMATSIGFTGPLMTTLMSLIFLKETISWKRWIGILVGYLGVLLIIRPEEGSFSFAVGISLLANVFAGGSIILARKLSGTDHPAIIMALSNGVNLLLLAFPAFLNWVPLTTSQSLLLIGVALTGTISQYFQINAVRLAKPSFLAPFEYFRLIFALPLGWFLLNETPTVMELIGSFIIIIATYYVTYTESIKKKYNFSKK